MRGKKIEIGEVTQSCSCGIFEVISEKVDGKYKVRFVETGYETCVHPTEVRNGKVKDKSHLDKYKEGSTFETLNHGAIVVVKYTNAANVLVEFTETGYKTNTCVTYIKSGKIGDKLKPSVCGVGFIGDGPYDSKTHKDLYNRWNGMMQRCYAEKFREGCYSGVTACPDWHNFQNFVEWSIKQIGFDVEGWELDKDIIIRGNRIYCPNACCFIPKRINSLLIKSGEYKSNGMLGGVHICNKNGYYRASYRDEAGNRLVLETPDLEKAENWYRKGKESVVKSIASLYEGIIDQRAYDALMRWEVSCENSSL